MGNVHLDQDGARPDAGPDDGRQLPGPLGDERGRSIGRGAGKEIPADPRDPRRHDPFGHIGDRGEETQRSGGEEDGAHMPANEVGGDAAEQRRTEDGNLREEIRDRLDQALHVTAMGIEVQVENGEVTLLGRVTDVDARWRAEQVVVNVAGVREVQNFLVACRTS